MIRVLVISFIFLTFGSAAQDQDTPEGRTHYRPGLFWFVNGFNSPKKGQGRKYNRLMVDVLYNDWIGNIDPFQNSWESIGANFYWMSDIQFSRESTASFGVGVCYGFWNIRHNNTISIDPIDQSTRYAPKNATNNYEVSSLRGHVFSVPIEFRFRTKGYQHFKVHIGFKFGYQLDLHNRYVYSEYKEKIFLKDDNNWVYSTYLRFGIRNFAIYAGYNLNTLLKNNANFNQNHIQMGLTISLM